MAIIRPESMDFSKQTFSAIIYGSPGVGKTTLALSAPSPVLIDFDHGISRVRAQHRAPTIICENYEEVLADVKSPEMREFETIVIDTGGSFVTYLKDWAMRVKGAKQKNGEFNSLKGFGYVKSEFASFTDYIKTVLNKNVIYVFHSQEQADKDGNPTQRLMCEGSVRNTVWNPCDFGGYVQMLDKRRMICFSPTQEYFAKGTHGITGEMPIPVLADGSPNDFMTKLFEKARQNIISENDAFAPQKKQYEETMEMVRTCIENVVDAETAKMAVETIRDFTHALTSKKEASAMLKAKTDALGLKYSKETGGYVPKEGGQ
ncbi:MAG: ATP-binding protein [Selenomonadaceae bacterium]|nr:ATP-binding protein [Selenomonadaceae bacterium]